MGNRSVRLTLLGWRVGTLSAFAPIIDDDQQGHQNHYAHETHKYFVSHELIDGDYGDYDDRDDEERDSPFRRSLAFCHGLLPEGVL